MKVIAIIAARMGSTRFPAKMMSCIGDETLLSVVVKRAMKIQQVDQVILATSSNKEDDLLASSASKMNVNVYRGHLEDVAGRFVGCIKQYQADYFVRLNGDSPFLDWDLIDAGIDFIREGEYDLITNIATRTFPYGVAVEIVRASAFYSAYPHMNPGHLEHVTSYFYEHIKKYKVKQILNPSMKSRYDFPLTIDTKEDLKRLTFYLKPNIFTSWKNIPHFKGDSG